MVSIKSLINATKSTPDIMKDMSRNTAKSLWEILDPVQISSTIINLMQGLEGRTITVTARYTILYSTVMIEMVKAYQIIAVKETKKTKEKKEMEADEVSYHAARKIQELEQARINKKQVGIDEMQALKDEGCVRATHAIKIPL